jgi:hypothetical protein
LDSLRIQQTAYQKELVDDIGPNVFGCVDIAIAAGAIAVAPFGKPAAIKRGCLIWVDAEGRVIINNCVLKIPFSGGPDRGCRKRAASGLAGVTGFGAVAPGRRGKNEFLFQGGRVPGELVCCWNRATHIHARALTSTVEPGLRISLRDRVDLLQRLQHPVESAELFGCDQCLSAGGC